MQQRTITLLKESHSEDIPFHAAPYHPTSSSFFCLLCDFLRRAWCFWDPRQRLPGSRAIGLGLYVYRYLRVQLMWLPLAGLAGAIFFFKALILAFFMILDTGWISFFAEDWKVFSWPRYICIYLGSKGEKEISDAYNITVCEYSIRNQSYISSAKL